MADYLFDTTIFVDYHRGDPGAKSLIERLIQGSISGSYCALTLTELWIGISTVSEEALRLTEDLTQGKDNVFALRVKGISMIDALIDDEDIVLMQEVKTVDDGDMAAVWLEEQQEVTLKKVYREKNRIRLQPANRQMEPLYQDPDNVEIQGKLIGVIRKLR